MAKIICKINIGLKNQKVYIQGQKYSNKQTLESYDVPIEDIAKFIISQEGINEVYLGGIKNYTEEIKNEIKDLEIQKYAKNTIKFFNI